MLADETFLQLLQSGPHWGLELTIEAVTGLLVYPLIRLGVRKHDERKHRHDCCDDYDEWLDETSS